MSKKTVKPFSETKELVRIIIETPKGSRTKYALDTSSGFLMVKKVLPKGMVFPFDFGAIPGTKGEDGDPLDVLLLIEQSLSVPCLVEGRLIGVIKASQLEKGKKAERNDRLVATADLETNYSASVKKMNSELLEEIEKFFINYNELEGKQFKCLGYGGPKAAMKLVKQGHKKYLSNK